MKADDPWALIEEGLASSDPVAVLNAFMVSGWLEARVPERRLAAPEARALLIRGVRTLERVYKPGAPDGSALRKLIGGSGEKSDRIFQSAFYWRLQPDWLKADQAGRDAVLDALVSLYNSSSNPVFRLWAEPILKNWRPNQLVVESPRLRLARLADECVKSAKKGSGTVTRSFVFRTDTPPTAETINRLYGPPIGLPADRVPVFGGRAMEHIITVETRLLSPAVRDTYENRGIVAIAVFLSSRIDHEAFEPETPHAAVVELNAADIAKGAAVVTEGEHTDRGIALDAFTCTLPESVFQGGAKKGALFELRQLLDREDFLEPDRKSPRWIQRPQPAGEFLFDLDGKFAGQASLNLGDMGRLYVFEKTAFIQS